MACGLPAASAQTTDPIFRSWRWTEEVTAPRALALGGAIVGLADDGSAAAFNPAGIATVPRAGEIQFAWRFGSQTTLASGDRLTSLGKAASPSSLVLRLGTHVGISYHFLTLRSASRIDFDDGREAGSLRTSVSGPGAGLGVRVSPFVTVGLSLNAVRFYIDEGEYTRGTPTGPPDLRVRFNSNGDTRVTGTLGALARLRELSFGTAFRLGRRWSGLRTATSPSSGLVIDEGTRFGVRSPDVFSAGVAWQPEKVRRAGTFLLSGQVDYLRLGQIEPAAVPGLPFPASDYRAGDSLELRVGGEMTFPFLTTWAARGSPWRPNRLQLRAGWHRQASGSLVYEGTDPGQRSLFPQSDSRQLVSAGVSVGATTIWRVSSGFRFGGDDWLAVAGLTIRYPGLFP
ncbi:MAG: hypothetical protein DMF80_11360 [Acidobacteria bacterium]|nr:MAG: hypothetical protein DMF80_11360 [Acidobacteriota bacterium]